MKQIAIFASGAGSNAARIIEHFRTDSSVRVSLVVSNKSDAGVLGIAAKEGIPTEVLDKERFFRGDGYVGLLTEKGIGFVVLAGFLWKVPATLVRAFKDRIVNIHPALLPAYGGKGMYGRFVHEAVIAAGEKASGITIHYVDEIYDHGRIIFQASCPIGPEDNPETLAAKIHLLEHQHFPLVLEGLLKDLPNQR